MKNGPPEAEISEDFLTLQCIFNKEIDIFVIQNPEIFPCGALSFRLRRNSLRKKTLRICVFAFFPPLFQKGAKQGGGSRNFFACGAFVRENFKKHYEIFACGAFSPLVSQRSETRGGGSRGIPLITMRRRRKF